MNREATKKEESPPKHYSHEAPPETLREAHARLDEVVTQINNIETQLQYNKLEDYPTKDAYHTWKRRAVKALGHLEAELEFLDIWLFDKEAVTILYQALMRAQEEGFTITEEEQKILDEFRESAFPIEVSRALPH